MRLLLFVMALSFGGCVDVPTGHACATSVDCEPGTSGITYECDTSMPGGYCTRRCNVEGHGTSPPHYSIDNCWMTGDSIDGICTDTHDAGLYPLECMRPCTRSSHCRAGYRCAQLVGRFGCIPE